MKAAVSFAVSMRSAAPAHAVESRLRVLDREPGALVFAVWRNVVFASWGAGADGARVRRLAAVLETVAGAIAGPRSSIHFVREGAGLPNESARDAFTALLDTNAERIACVGVIVESSGFWSGAQRSAALQVRLRSTASIGHRIVGTIEEMLEWFPREHARRSGVAIDAKELDAVLRSPALVP